MTVLPPAVAAYREVAMRTPSTYRPAAPRIRSTPGAVVLSGFAQHQTGVTALPFSEQSRLEALAVRIVESYRSGEPVRIVQVIGHADRDPRGPRFEQQVSQQRAAAVRAFLQQRAQARGVSGPITGPTKLVPVANAPAVAPNAWSSPSRAAATATSARHRPRPPRPHARFDLQLCRHVDEVVLEERRPRGRQGLTR